MTVSNEGTTSGKLISIPPDSATLDARDVFNNIRKAYL
jgi:hypothetical protein